MIISRRFCLHVDPALADALSIRPVFAIGLIFSVADAVVTTSVSGVRTISFRVGSTSWAVVLAGT